MDHVFVNELDKGMWFIVFHSYFFYISHVVFMFGGVSCACEADQRHLLAIITHLSSLLTSFQVMSL